jgi:dehydrogenase/reductase SDR family protein 12
MPLAGALDTLLDRTVLLGYGKVGVHVRRRLPGWPADPPRMDGRVVMVTGAASGIGLAACRGFAALGATVRPVVRSQERAEEATREIERARPSADVQALVCDVSSLEALRGLANGLRDEGRRLDVVVNNAGTMPDQRRRSADGHELMFATHVLGPFALTSWLSEQLADSAPARVINVSSGGMYTQRLPVEDWESVHAAYSPPRIYARTKREEVVITEMWAEKLRDRGVVVHAMHPGWVDTPGVSGALPGFRSVSRPILRTPDEGADTIVWLGGAPEAVAISGLFWHDRRPRPTHHPLGPSRDDPRARQGLWDYCQALSA